MIGHLQCLEIAEDWQSTNGKKQCKLFINPCWNGGVLLDYLGEKMVGQGFISLPVITLIGSAIALDCTASSAIKDCQIREWDF